MMGALALTFAACEDGPSKVPVQTNPQGPVLEAGSVEAIAAGPLTTGTLDITDEMTSVLIATVESVDTVLSDATVSFGFDYASKSDFSDAISLDVTMEGNNGYVEAADLQAAHIALFGKSTDAKIVYYRIPLYVELNGVNYRWGGVDYYCAEGTYSETLPASAVTEPQYLCTPGGYNGWSQTASSWVPLRESDSTYRGAILASGEFKLTDGDTWDDDKTWGLGDEGGTLSQPGNGNIPVAEDGLQ